MRPLYFLCLIAAFATACKKSSSDKSVNVLPAMHYTDLKDYTIGIGQGKLFDLDGDGHRDLGFSTLLVGDPQLPGDKAQFYATGSFTTYFTVNPGEECPRLETGAAINLAAFPGYEWFNASSILLAQRVELVNGLIYWEGPWKASSHRFFPFYILRDTKRYFGWVELSFDTTAQQVTLHRAAVSLEAEKGAEAGVK